MRVRFFVMAAVGLLLVAAVPGPRASASAACAAAGSRTVLKTGDVRVYSRRLAGDRKRRFYGCSFAVGARWFLGPPRSRELEAYAVGGFRAAGTVVAYLRSETAFRAANAGTTVHVRSLRTGRARAFNATTEQATGEPSGGYVPTHVVRRTGSVAWIARNEVLARFEVFRAVAGRRKLLEASPDVDPTSLRLARRTLTWTTAGERRTATLP
jgi:hypothetical protein